MHCPKCGAMLKDGASFCGKCGHKVSNITQSAAPANASQGRHAAPAQSTPQVSYAAPTKAATSGTSVNIRNIIAAIGAVVAIVGFAQPWIKMSSAATTLSSGANSVSSALLGKSLYAFDSTYNLFGFGSLGAGMESYASSGGAYTFFFGCMFAAACIVSALLIIGGILALAKNKATLMRVAGILCVVACVVIMLFLVATSNSSNSAFHYVFTIEMTGCVLSVIGGLVAAICPQTVK